MLSFFRYLERSTSVQLLLLKCVRYLLDDNDLDQGGRDVAQSVQIPSSVSFPTFSLLGWEPNLGKAQGLRNMIARPSISCSDSF